MPEYNYKCKECGVAFTQSHSMKERLEECPSCKSLHTLQRLPSNFFMNKIDKKEKVGALVKRSIEEIREELLKEKKSLKEELHD